MMGIAMNDMSAPRRRKRPIRRRLTAGGVAEIISLIHRVPAIPVPDILAGIHEGMANSLHGISQKVGMQSDVVMCGGVARNIDVVRRVEAKLGAPVLIPEDPQILGALGAALFAQQ
jgi:activator of 2-hydroxyglutaryl-CoA dehydratase